MKLDYIYEVLLFVALILLQVLLFNQISVFGYATPFLYIYFLMKLPIGRNVFYVIIMGFLMGITIDKGSLDGISPDMGVISSQGVVGVVRNVSKHSAVIIPIINPKFRLGAKLKNSDNFGTIAWDGRSADEAQLREMPKHELFAVGDTVVTGFSRIFPEGIIVGYTKELGISPDDNFNTFSIRLATNFHTLQHVLIIDDKYHLERTALETSVN